MLMFEVSNGGPTPVDIDDSVGGIVCKFRNHTWLWLTALEEGQQMLGLLRKAKVDDGQFVRWRVGYSGNLVGGLGRREKLSG